MLTGLAIEPPGRREAWLSIQYGRSNESRRLQVGAAQVVGWKPHAAPCCIADYEGVWAPERGSVGIGVPDDADPRRQIGTHDGAEQRESVRFVVPGNACAEGQH
jgi:hypothetical protein